MSLGWDRYLEIFFAILPGQTVGLGSVSECGAVGTETGTLVKVQNLLPNFLAQCLEVIARPAVRAGIQDDIGCALKNTKKPLKKVGKMAKIIYRPVR